MVTLNKDLNGTKLDQPVEYQRVGVPVYGDADRDLKFPLHFAVADGFLDTVIKRLRKQEADYDQRSKDRVVKNKLSDGSKKKASNGLVF